MHKRYIDATISLTFSILLALVMVSIIPLTLAIDSPAADFYNGYAFTDIVNGSNVTLTCFGGNAIQPVSDGGYIVVASCVYGDAYQEYALLIKLDAKGSPSWVKAYNDSEAFGVRQTRDGGYIIAGERGHGSLVKTDADGNVLWCRTYGNCDYLYAVREIDDGFVSSGYRNSVFAYPYIQKVDKQGNVQWSITPEDMPLNGLENWRPDSLSATRDNGFVTVYTGNNNDDSSPSISLLKIDSTGHVQWNRTYGDAQAYSCLETSDGGYVIAGSERDKALLIKTDSLGNVQWRKSYGNETEKRQGYGLIRDDDGGYVVSGQSDNDAMIFKTDSDGVQQWIKRYRPAGYNDFNSVVKTTGDNYIMTGRMDAGVLAVKTDSRSGTADETCQYFSIPIVAIELPVNSSDLPAIPSVTPTGAPALPSQVTAVGSALSMIAASVFAIVIAFMLYRRASKK